jgi:hypothetical protein
MSLFQGGFMKTIFIMLFTWQVSAGAPVYTVLEQSSAFDKASSNGSITKMNAKSISGDVISFDLNSNKSSEGESMVRFVKINGQTFNVGLQDEFDPSQSVPFFKLSFPEDSLDKDIYVLAGPKGTSGVSFHYFIKSKNGSYSYSGLHPEITYDEENKTFYSVEKDGPRAHITTWKLDGSHFVAQTTESVR